MKKVLVIVDMQNDFVSPDGKLPVPQALDIVETINKLRQKAYESDVRVLYTKDWHDKDDPEFKYWPEHCVKGTNGAEVVDALKPKEGDYIIEKQRLSAFTNPKIRETLDDITEIYLTGVATEYCDRGFALGEPENNIKGAADLGIKVNLIVDAIKGVDEIPGVPNTRGKIVYAALEMGNKGVKPMYASEALENLAK